MYRHQMIYNIGSEDFNQFNIYIIPENKNPVEINKMSFDSLIGVSNVCHYSTDFLYWIRFRRIIIYNSVHICLLFPFYVKILLKSKLYTILDLGILQHAQACS